MVPRDDPSSGVPRSPQPSERGLFSRMFLSWRRTLTRLLTARAERPTGDARTSVRERAREVRGYLRDPAATLSAAGPDTLRRLRAAGLTALAAGAVLTVPAGVLARRTWADIVFDVVWLLAWAFVRLLLMRLSAAAVARDKVDAVWAPALMPEVFAVIFPLDVAALGYSAWLTYAGFTGLGVPSRDSRRPVLWAFGGQLAVQVGAWLARGSLIAFLASRG